MIELDDCTYVSDVKTVRAIRGADSPDKCFVLIFDFWIPVKRDPGYLAGVLKAEAESNPKAESNGC